MAEMTHFDASGKARMVDTAAKPETHRVAVASGLVRMRVETRRLIESGTAAKGDVLGTARLAAIMAAKKTGEWIPLCHPIPLTSVDVAFDFVGDDAVRVQATVGTVGRTGVEMEALTAVSAAALTIYDMCKAVDRGMVIERIVLESKTGGRSGSYARDNDDHRGGPAE